MSRILQYYFVFVYFPGFFFFPSREVWLQNAVVALSALPLFDNVIDVTLNFV